MFVEDKLSTLTAVAASPGFEAWELYLGASRMECLYLATMSSGLSLAHSLESLIRRRPLPWMCVQ